MQVDYLCRETDDLFKIIETMDKTRQIDCVLVDEAQF